MDDTLTVAELVTLLLTQPQDAKVKTEGCDCYGNARGIDFHPASQFAVSYILIKRD